MSDSPRVLLVKLSSLGDLFHALPAADQLQRQLGASIHWVTQPEYAGLVRSFDPVDEVIEFPRKDMAGGFGPFQKQLRQCEYDAVINLHGQFKGGLVTRLARAKNKLGPPKRNEAVHAVDACLEVIRPLAGDLDDIRFPWTCPAWEAGPGALRVAIAPCSRHASKNWPLDRYIELAKTLLEYEGLQIHLLGGPGEADACRRMEETLASDRVSNLCAATPLEALGGVLKAMDLVVCNDSGPMHMAAAVETPVLALFGPTNPKRTGPYGEQHVILQPPGEDGRAHKYRGEDDSLIRGIELAMVVEKARELLTL